MSLLHGERPDFALTAWRFEMTTQNDQPLGLIDVSAIEYEARAARAEIMRATVVALPALVAQVIARLRSKRESQTGVFA
jgi:hypothetical protein